MTETARTYGGVSAEDRRARRRTALMEAALDLLCEGGANAVSKRGICERARLTDRYFYEHFADRDAILDAIMQEATSQGFEAVVTAALQPADNVKSQFRAGVDAGLTFITADPRRGSLLLNSHTSDVIERARKTSVRAGAAVAAATTRELLGDSAPNEQDAYLSAYAAVSGVLELIAAWLRDEFDTSREHLTDLVTAILWSGVGVVAELPDTISLHTPS